FVIDDIAHGLSDRVMHRAMRVFGRRLGSELLLSGHRKNQSPPTKQPGLKMPAGSNVAFIRPIRLSVGVGGSSKKFRSSRAPGDAARMRRWPCAPCAASP